MSGKSIDVLKSEASSGGPDEWYELGMHYVSQRNLDDALCWLKKASDAGHIKSMQKLWPLYSMAQKPVECMTVLQKLATEHKDPLAMIEMGLRCDAEGISLDEVKPTDLIDTGIKMYVLRDGDISKISWQHKVQVSDLYSRINKDSQGRNSPVKLWMTVQLLENVLENNYDTLKKAMENSGIEASRNLLSSSKAVLKNLEASFNSLDGGKGFKQDIEDTYGIKIS